VTVVIPSKCILDPSDTAAVVGGNVLTCQRVVDVVFRAFEVCAASQGCMNNITFGDESVGYYETVAGGAGAVSQLYLCSCTRAHTHTHTHTHNMHACSHIHFISMYTHFIMVNLASDLFRDQHGMVAVEYTLT